LFRSCGPCGGGEAVVEEAPRVLTGGVGGAAAELLRGSAAEQTVCQNLALKEQLAKEEDMKRLSERV
jgi:hypothetical protein